MAKKIKPQRAQGVVIFLFYRLCVHLCSMWFFKTLNRKYQKVSWVLVTATIDAKDPNFYPIRTPEPTIECQTRCLIYTTSC